jgi:putative lipoic acid-binding regulatory protein
MIDLNNHKLKLDYPCSWSYKIVLLQEHNANAIARNVLNDREYKVSKSKVSSKGKFKSYNIDLMVHSDEDRTNLHKFFGEHKNVKMVV